MSIANRLRQAVTACDLVDLGHAGVLPQDSLPEPGGKSLLLVGNAGSRFWRHFEASDEYADRRADPLNRWSKRVLTKIAETHDVTVLLPFEGPPYYPFQQWALRTGRYSTSPLGVLAHRRFGLWFAFRGAFVLSEPCDIPSEPAGGPCENCLEKPCLSACPAAALTRDRAYSAEICRDYVASEGAATCATRGCLVRHACPFGGDYAYSPVQATFHMRAFVGREPRG